MAEEEEEVVVEVEEVVEEVVVAEEVVAEVVATEVGSRASAKHAEVVVADSVVGK